MEGGAEEVKVEVDVYEKEVEQSTTLDNEGCKES